VIFQKKPDFCSFSLFSKKIKKMVEKTTPQNQAFFSGGSKCPKSAFRRSKIGHFDDFRGPNADRETKMAIFGGQKIEKTPFFAKKRIFFCHFPKSDKNRHFLAFFAQKVQPPIVGT